MIWYRYLELKGAEQPVPNFANYLELTPPDKLTVANRHCEHHQPGHAEGARPAVARPATCVIILKPF